ncbi:Gfo/Idh/MocA family protein [Alicyclobacillus tolerans]|uniref:Gfo/Idh/MocA family protein n=1 Tax=Alicyclobacillus tolerans TaxID=90970 RepID=UPI003B8033D9
MMRVALLSGWHVHAAEYAQYAVNHSEVELHFIWDTDEIRGRAFAERFDAMYVQNLNDIWEQVDGVIIASPTNQHFALISEALKQGKHVFSEKVLAMNLDECRKIREILENKNVVLTLCLPRLSDAYFLYAVSALEQGLLGRLHSIRCRLHHDGILSSAEHPQGWLPAEFLDRSLTGGGALIDLGAHPIYLANRLAGTPVSVSALFSSFYSSDVEDQATVCVKYESGCVAVLETGFVSGQRSFLLELHGSDGSLMVDQQSVRIASRHLPHQAWQTPLLPKPLPHPFSQWVATVLHHEPQNTSWQDIEHLTLINDAAQLSHQKRRIVDISEIGGLQID